MFLGNRNILQRFQRSVQIERNYNNLNSMMQLLFVHKGEGTVQNFG